MSSPAPCSSRIARIDEVRGILILLVLFYHLIYDIGLFFPAAATPVASDRSFPAAAGGGAGFFYPAVRSVYPPQLQ